MRFTRWSGALAVATVTLVACQKAESPEQATTRMQGETEAARAPIAAQVARWMRYANANQVDSLPELYTPDAVLLPTDMPGAGRCMVLWRMDADGVWRLHRDIGSDAPVKP
jgi:ketosteroid isomerase-like protein